jgi:hypothetical protein
VAAPSPPKSNEKKPAADDAGKARAKASSA